jgi:hypothetical protein
MKTMSGVSVYAELVNDKFETIQRKSALVDEDCDFTVQPGKYLLRVTTPSGETSSTVALVEKGERKEVLFKARPSPHEWLEMTHFMGDLGIQEPQSRSSSGAVQVRDDEQLYDSSYQILREPSGLQKERPVRLRRTLNDDEFSRSWMRVWSKSAGGWEVMDSFPGDLQVLDEMYQKYSLDLALESQYLLQMGGPNAAWRLIALPPSPGRVELVVHLAAQGNEIDGNIEVAIGSGDTFAETLLRYLALGNVDAARTIGDETIRRAEEMLRSKMANPFNATVAGYFLLKINAYDRLHDWVNNLSNMFPSLPDGPIIHAWQLMLQPNVPNVRTARMRLLEATRRGIPVYSQGMRLLIDGLQIFAEEAKAENLNDNEVTEALSWAAKYAGAAQRLGTLTSFYGADPNTPSLKIVKGVPKDVSGLSFVRENVPVPA